MSAPTTILVCDDEAVIRSLIRATLRDGGYRIAEAADGEEALEVARVLKPDLILLDMMMPGKTGLEVLRELRRNGDSASTPVVMLTADKRAADRAALDDAGADRYLAKPFSPAQLETLVADLLRKSG